MRVALIAVASLPFLFAPAFAGDMGSGGCSGKSKQVNAAADTTKPLVIASMDDAKRAMRVKYNPASSEQLAALITTTVVTQ